MFLGFWQHNSDLCLCLPWPCFPCITLFLQGHQSHWIKSHHTPGQPQFISYNNNLVMASLTLFPNEVTVEGDLIFFERHNSNHNWESEVLSSWRHVSLGVQPAWVSLVLICLVLLACLPSLHKLRPPHLTGKARAPLMCAD